MDWHLQHGTDGQTPNRGQWSFTADGKQIQMVCPQCNPDCVDTKPIDIVIMINKAVLKCAACHNVVLCTLEGYPG